jgi:hypothetical protein
MRETPTEWRIRDSGFPAIDRLLRRPAFQYGDDWEPLFVAAMREAFEHHLAGSPSSADSPSKRAWALATSARCATSSGCPGRSFRA